MKITKNEFGHDYLTYRFGYCEHAMLEPNDRIADFYEKGFLPYSADPVIRGVFYMARSARIELPRFEFTSENRRIWKRFDGAFSFRRITAHEAKENPQIRGLFVEYFKGRHGRDIMPAKRFDAILDWPLPIHVLMYEKNGELLAAVLDVVGRGTEATSTGLLFGGGSVVAAISPLLAALVVNSFGLSAIFYYVAIISTVAAVVMLAIPLKKQTA